MTDTCELSHPHPDHPHPDHPCGKQVDTGKVVTGAELVDTWSSKHHRSFKICPGCGQDCSTVGVAALAYTFEECDCDRHDYAHLVEQLWHLKCLQPVATDKHTKMLLGRVTTS